MKKTGGADASSPGDDQSSRRAWFAPHVDLPSDSSGLPDGEEGERLLGAAGAGEGFAGVSATGVEAIPAAPFSGVVRGWSADHHAPAAGPTSGLVDMVKVTPLEGVGGTSVAGGGGADDAIEQGVSGSSGGGAVSESALSTSGAPSANPAVSSSGLPGCGVIGNCCSRWFGGSAKGEALKDEGSGRALQQGGSSGSDDADGSSAKSDEGTGTKWRVFESQTDWGLDLEGAVRAWRGGRWGRVWALA